MFLMRHFFSAKRRVEVDECPSCGGIWLDPGELGEIRSEFSSEEERNKATDKLFHETFSGQLSAMMKESQEKAERAKRIAHTFRYLCPSYYIPGKQDWGNF